MSYACGCEEPLLIKRTGMHKLHLDWWGDAGVMLKLRELQERAHGRLLVTLAEQLKGVIGENPPLDWLPEQPVSTASRHSQYILDLIKYLQASSLPLPPSSPCFTTTPPLFPFHKFCK